ncbi:MAG: hypothetical protein JJD97_02700 [Gemmatimonadaceae bacterium]|nr:hypothetical protein [Gemmatimonadaceae bacterium]
MIRKLSVSATITGIALLASCGGFKSTWPSVTGVSAQTVSVSVNCIAEQAKSLGYDVRVVDHKRGVEATRNDTSNVRYVNEFRRFDVLSATAKPEKGSTRIEVQAGTRSHYQTRRGTTPTDEPASEAAKKDAQTIATACGGGTS